MKKRNDNILYTYSHSVNNTIKLKKDGSQMTLNNISCLHVVVPMQQLTK